MKNNTKAAQKELTYIIVPNSSKNYNKLFKQVSFGTPRFTSVNKKYKLKSLEVLHHPEQLKKFYKNINEFVAIYVLLLQPSQF